VRDHAFLRKHRTEATEGNWKRGNGLGDMAASSARSRVFKKASHRGHRGHGGELERENGLVTWRLPVRDHGFLKQHRTEVTEATEGELEKGKKGLVT
jgi:hypothetical protein